MEVDDIPQIDPNVDYSEIQPIQQKRTITFVNHFLLSTVSMLNNFTNTCESRLMQFEYKLQKIEASLLILESQLSSIPHLDDAPIEAISVDLPDVPAVDTSDDSITASAKAMNDDCANNVDHDMSNESQMSSGNDNPEPSNEQNGPSAKNDPRFSKFFKMLQVGVPAVAVRLKMQMEGVDPNILDSPNSVIPAD